MNTFTVNALEAADALAWLDHDGAPPAVTPPQASDRQGRHAIRLAGTGQVTASPGGDDRSSVRPRRPPALPSPLQHWPPGSMYTTQPVLPI